MKLLHQPTRLTSRRKRKIRRRRNQDKPEETDESPMILDEEDQKQMSKRCQRRERDFPTIPYLPTKETLTRLSATSILYHILMTTED